MKQYNIKDIGEITIRKNRRSKRLRATAKSNGEISVTIPYYVSYKEALNFIISHKNKILEIKEKVAKHKVEHEKFEIGKTYNTKFHKVSLQKSDKPSLYMQQNEKEIIIHFSNKIKELPDNVQIDIRDIFREIYRLEAKIHIVPRTYTLAEKFELHFNRVTIKNIKTRWGSCSSKNNINLNLNLMRLPDELIDYVILHELAHLKHPNHSPEFWNFLGTMISNPKKYDKELKKYSLQQFAT